MYPEIAGLSSEIKTMIMATMPIGELRVALPLAYFKFQMPILESLFWSVIGNMVPAIILLYIFTPIVDWLRKRIKLVKKITDWWFKKVRDKHAKKFEKWGALVLISVVAIPLPGTGAWTGVIVSYLFKIKYWKALLLIFLGVVIAGLIVSLISLGIFQFI